MKDESKETFHQLIGMKVDAVFALPMKCGVVLVGDNQVVSITHPQDCCEYAYIYHLNQIEYLIGGTIIGFRHLDYTAVPNCDEDEDEDEDEDKTVEQYGWLFTTEKGTTTFETRLESNGNYGGDYVVSLGANVGNDMVELKEDF